jgi:hypothetical protein
VESFKLRVKVLLTIRLIDELMQPSSILLVRGEVFQADNIPALSEIHQLQTDFLSAEIELLKLGVLVDC